MTYEEARELCMDILNEYLPKGIPRASKESTVEILLDELLERGALGLEETSDEETSAEDERDLLALIRDA